MDTSAFAGYWEQIKNKGLKYWFQVFVIGAAGLYIGERLAEINPPGLRELRYKFYQCLSDSGFIPSSRGDILIVAIKDEEYWKGELAGRKPIKRDYLAKLVDKLCSARPKLIALDFDLRSPVTDGTMLDHSDYKAETEKLAASIINASRDCRIVLPKTLTCATDSESCAEEASVLDTYRFDSARVTRGYINLPDDIRLVPLGHTKITGGLKSFAEAIASADSGIERESLPKDAKLPYGSFIWPKGFPQGRAFFSAGEILTSKPTSLRAAIEHKTVIVGGEWSRAAYQRGGKTDMHPSPVGEISGVYLQANYAAAILDGRIYGNNKKIGVMVEVLLVGLVAISFAIRLRSGTRRALIFLATFGLMLVSYVFWQNFGIFLEPVIPVIFLFLHWIYDENRHLRERLRACEEMKVSIK